MKNTGGTVVKWMKSVLMILSINFIFVTGCENVRMDYPRSVANFFCKALIKGDLNEAKKLSTLSDEEIKSYISKIKGVYEDFTVDERIQSDTHIEKITFVPKNAENSQWTIELTMKRVGAEYRVGTVNTQILTKEQTVKEFVAALLSAAKEKASGFSTLSSAEIDKAIQSLKGMVKFEILQLSARESAVLIEVKNNQSSKMLNLTVSKTGDVFKIVSLKIE